MCLSTYSQFLQFLHYISTDFYQDLVNNSLNTVKFTKYKNVALYHIIYVSTFYSNYNKYFHLLETEETKLKQRFVKYDLLRIYPIISNSYFNTFDANSKN